MRIIEVFFCFLVFLCARVKGHNEVDCVWQNNRRVVSIRIIGTFEMFSNGIARDY